MMVCPGLIFQCIGILLKYMSALQVACHAEWHRLCRNARMLLTCAYLGAPALCRTSLTNTKRLDLEAFPKVLARDRPWFDGSPTLWQ